MIYTFLCRILLSVATENYTCGYHEGIEPTWYYSWYLYLNDYEVRTGYKLKESFCEDPCRTVHGKTEITKADDMIISLIEKVRKIANSKIAKRLAKDLSKSVRHTLRKRF